MSRIIIYLDRTFSNYDYCQQDWLTFLVSSVWSVIFFANIFFWLINLFSFAPIFICLEAAKQVTPSSTHNVRPWASGPLVPSLAPVVLQVSGLRWHYMETNLLLGQIKSFLQPAYQPRESEHSKSLFSTFTGWIRALLSEQMDCFQHLELMNKS